MATVHGERAGFNNTPWDHEFLDLLVNDPEKLTKMTVAEYAKELGITAPHLNAICKQMGGAPALTLIHERWLLAARRALSYTDKSIADVATSLGFAEPSYFARFFKRKMRMTPQQYRRQTGTVRR